MTTLSAGSSCGEARQEPLGPDELRSWQTCASADDCTLVLNGCCCELVAIRADRAVAFRELFACEEACTCEPREVVVRCNLASLCTAILR